jgi:hypothetical protein
MLRIELNDEGMNILEDVGHIFLEKVSKTEYKVYRRFPHGLGWVKQKFTTEKEAREYYLSECEDDANMARN